MALFNRCHIWVKYNMKYNLQPMVISVTKKHVLALNTNIIHLSWADLPDSFDSTKTKHYEWHYQQHQWAIWRCNSTLISIISNKEEIVLNCTNWNTEFAKIKLRFFQFCNSTQKSLWEHYFVLWMAWTFGPRSKICL